MVGTSGKKIDVIGALLPLTPLFSTASGRLAEVAALAVRALREPRPRRAAPKHARRALHLRYLGDYLEFGGDRKGVGKLRDQATTFT